MSEGFINVPLDEAEEQMVVSDGAYGLRIVGCELGESKKGVPMVTARIEIMDEPDAALIYHYMQLPTAEEDERTNKNRVRQLARFVKTFNIPSEGSGFDPADAVGCTAEKVMVTKEPAQGEFPEQNRIRLPRLDD